MRERGEIPEPEEDLLGYERPSIEQEAQTEAERLEKLEFRRAFLSTQMTNPMFREWLMEVLVGFGAFTNPFGVSPTGFPDSSATQFQLGMKAAGWHLWEMFDNIAPELASLMRREAAGLVAQAAPVALTPPGAPTKAGRQTNIVGD